MRKKINILYVLFFLCVNVATAQSGTHADSAALMQALGKHFKVEYPGTIRVSDKVYRDNHPSAHARDTSGLSSVFPQYHDSLINTVLAKAGATLGPLSKLDLDCTGIPSDNPCALVGLDTYIMLSKPVIFADTAVFQALVTRKAPKPRMPRWTVTGTLTFVRQQQQWSFIKWKRESIID